jgi:hypothetical protein
MVVFTMEKLELPTAHAWHIQHLEKVPYITRKP